MPILGVLRSKIEISDVMRFVPTYRSSASFGKIVTGMSIWPWVADGGNNENRGDARHPIYLAKISAMFGLDMT